MAKRRKSGFSIGDIKKESFRYREDTKAVATPVANYSIPKGISGDAEALIKSLENITQAASTGFKLRTQTETKKGRLAAGSGAPRPTGFFNQTAAAAYDRFNGIGDTAKIQDQLTGMHKKAVDNLQNQKDLNTEDYAKLQANHNKSIDQAINKLLEKKPEDYILGLQENIKSHIGTLEQQFQKEAGLHLQKQGLKNITNSVDRDMANIINKANEDFKDPAEAQQVVSKAARQLLSQQQDIAYKMYGITKPQVSKLFVDVRGQKAVFGGHPEDLLFLQEADADGYRLIDSPDLRKAGLGYLKQAIAVKKQMLANAESAAAKRKAATALVIGQKFAVAANTLEPTDAGKWAEMRNTVTAASDYFSAPELNTMYALIDKMQDPGGFSRVGDDLPVFQTLMLQAQNGNLDVNKLIRNADVLTKPTYMKIFGEHMSALGRAATDRKKTAPMSKVEKNLKSLQRSTIAMSGATMDMVGNIIKKVDGDPRQVKFSQDVQMLWMYKTSNPKDFTDKNGNLDVKAVQATQQEIWTELSPEYPELTAKLITGNSNAVEADRLPTNTVEKQKKQLTNDLDKFIEEDAK